MKGGNTKTLGVLILAATVLMLSTGCTTTVVQSELPCPARPRLEAITTAEQIEIDPQVVLKIAQNQLRLKEYAKKLEVRANCKED